MSQKLPVDGSEWRKDKFTFVEEFIQDYSMMKTVAKDTNSKLMLSISKIHDLHSDMWFLLQRMKIDKCKKLLSNLHNKKSYNIHIKVLNHELDHRLNALDHRLKLKKVHRVSSSIRTPD